VNVVLLSKIPVIACKIYIYFIKSTLFLKEFVQNSDFGDLTKSDLESVIP